ncbi:MAG: polysaccharide deacetylase family protein [Solirubrobacterales bacterium]
MSLITVREHPVPDKAVALTFDDSPDVKVTPKIMDTLEENNARATWFVQGMRGRGVPKLLRSIQSRGHDLATQSFDPVDLTHLSKSQVMDQIGRTKTIIEDAAGAVSPHFRPPFGTYNDTVLNIARELGYKANILWSIDPRDLHASVNQIITRTLSSLKPGAIVLFHEINEKTRQALPEILEGMKQRGYQALPLGQLLALQPSVALTGRVLALIAPALYGDDVRMVQQALHGAGVSACPIDGVFGRETAAAVRRFQELNGLLPTGNVGPDTYAALGIPIPNLQ